MGRGKSNKLCAGHSKRVRHISMPCGVVISSSYNIATKLSELHKKKCDVCREYDGEREYIRSNTNRAYTSQLRDRLEIESEHNQRLLI